MSSIKNHSANTLLSLISYKTQQKSVDILLARLRSLATIIPPQNLVMGKKNSVNLTLNRN